MKLRRILCVTVFALCVLSTASTASAIDLTNLIRRPIQRINPYVPIVDISTAVPTTSDILAVPRPLTNNQVFYPQELLRYGQNVHPGARVLRQNGLMLIQF